MAMTMTLEGALEVRKLLQELGDQAPEATGAALYQEGNELLNASKDLVPVDTGNLIGSGTVDQPTGMPIEVVVGYKGPYALSIHENPRSGQTGGVSPSGKKYKHYATVGQWKYFIAVSFLY